MSPSDAFDKVAGDNSSTNGQPTDTIPATDEPTEEGYDSGDSEFEITSEVAHGEEDDDSIAADDDMADEEEIDSLMKESEMSLNDLLASYGLPANMSHMGDASSSNDNNSSVGNSSRSMRKRRQTFDSFDQKSINDTVNPSQQTLGVVESKIRNSVEKEAITASKSTRREELKSKLVTEDERQVTDNNCVPESQEGNKKKPPTSTNAFCTVEEESTDVPILLQASESREDIAKVMHEEVEEEEDEEENTPGSYSPSQWCQALAAGGSPPTYDSEEDEDYHPSVEGGGNWRGEVRVGDEYQATVGPQTIVTTTAKRIEEDSHLGYDCRLIWRPRGNDGRLSEADVIRYEQAYTRAPTSSIRQFPDDEEALFWLLRADFDTDEALKRLEFKPIQPSEILPFFEAWSEAECTAFEKGYVTFNKNFHQIQQARLRHKTVAELVHFYYLWKKTARHDDFVRFYRREKKKPLHPGITDFMDCLIEEQQYSELHHLSNDNNNSNHQNNHPQLFHQPPHGMVVAYPLHNATAAASGTISSEANHHQTKPLQIDGEIMASAMKRASATDIGGFSVNLQELIDDPDVSISPRLRVIDPPPSSSPQVISQLES